VLAESVSADCLVVGKSYVCFAIICVFRFLLHVVTMFPYSAPFWTEFSFEGQNVLAKSSNDDVRYLHLSHSNADQIAASLSVTLDSEG